MGLHDFPFRLGRRHPVVNSHYDLIFAMGPSVVREPSAGLDDDPLPVFVDRIPRRLPEILACSYAVVQITLIWLYF